MIVFQHKSSSKRLLKKCYSNEKSFKKKAIPPEASVDHMNMKHERNLKRNWTAREIKEHPLESGTTAGVLTFIACTEEISNMTGPNAVLYSSTELALIDFIVYVVGSKNG